MLRLWTTLILFVGSGNASACEYFFQSDSNQVTVTLANNIYQCQIINGENWEFKHYKCVSMRDDKVLTIGNDSETGSLIGNDSNGNSLEIKECTEATNIGINYCKLSKAC